MAHYIELFAAQDVRIDYFFEVDRRARVVIFVFCPFLNKIIDGNPYGGGHFLSSGFDVISFKTTRDDWFQSIPSYAFVEILSFLDEKHHEQRIGYGSSMGGFGAIVFSNILKFDLVVTISPQFSISDEFDQRWSQQAEGINFCYKIEPKTICASCKFFIFYDNMDSDDLHARRLAEVIMPEQLELIRLPNTSHPSIYFLNDVGMLKNLVFDIIAGVPFQTRKIMSLKQFSHSYLYLLSRKLFSRSKYSQALRVISSAITLYGNISSYYVLCSNTLERLGDAVGSIEMAREALKHDAPRSDLYYFISKKLLASNLIKEALSYSELAVSLTPNNIDILWNHSFLLECSGRLEEALSVIDSTIKIFPDKAPLRVHRVRILELLGPNG